MGALKWIVIWGGVATACAIIGGIVAARRNRNASMWAAWCFIFPPAIIVVLLLSRNRGPRPQRPTLDDEDREIEVS